MSSQSSPEDVLSGMFKFMGSGKAEGKGASTLLGNMIRNSQLVMLKQVRQQLDSAIESLTKQMKTGADDYDESLDPFKILGVSMDASEEEVKEAFKNKAWTAHPDHGGTQEQMVRVNASYEAIRQLKGWKK